MQNGTGKILQQAQAAHQSGALAQAKTLYESVLAKYPDHSGALMGLGLLAYQTGRLDIAELYLARAAAANPQDTAIHFHRGNVFNHQGQNDRALESYDRALALEPAHPFANANRGVMLERMGKLDEAIAAFDRALAAKPDFTTAHFNRGNALQKAARFREALEGYDRVLALQPGHADAANNRGNVLKALGRGADALASFEQAIALGPGTAAAFVNRGNALKASKPREALDAYNRALALDPNEHTAHLGRGNLLFEIGRHDEALVAYDRAPGSASALLGRGNALFQLRRLDDAMAAYDQALALERGMAKAWLGRGNILFLHGDMEAAQAAYDKALAFDAELENAWLGRGNIFQQSKDIDRAAESYGRVLALNPGHPFTKGMLLHMKMLACDWSGLDEMIGGIESGIAKGKPVAEPFGWQGISASPESLQRCARIYAATLYPAQPSPPHPPASGEKIRIGYLSGEFRDQATAQLLVGVLEQHDRAHFEIVAFDNGFDDGSDIRRRIQNAVRELVPIAAMSDADAAEAIRARGIDILVNLNGYFGAHRMAVFARRPAPLQVNYLGFPGTLGADYMDYILADRLVIPEEDKLFFDERVAWLPHCYQANDRIKPISDTGGSRARHGLPADGFVFCCFNNSYKILPELFARWTRILREVPGSVLWLVEENELAVTNLRGQAVLHGVDEKRLVFAPRLPLPEHLARHRPADLFLDTMPYNAHTTASDALWAGLPLLTCRGTAFAGRVATSLLTAIGLPELIADTPDDYEIWRSFWRAIRSGLPPCGKNWRQTASPRPCSTPPASPGAWKPPSPPCRHGDGPGKRPITSPCRADLRYFAGTSLSSSPVAGVVSVMEVPPESVTT
jgi:protein O-GlcNAc transferase